MKLKSTLLALLLLLGAAGNSFATDDLHSTPAVQGNDVVSSHSGKRPVSGNSNYFAYLDGATYRLSSTENQEATEDTSVKSLPAYGGYCAFGTPVGKILIGDSGVWLIVDRRLYRDLDPGIQSDRLKDVPGRNDSADSRLQRVANKDPRSL
jgi:hypothetical protein